MLQIYPPYEPGQTHDFSLLQEPFQLTLAEVGDAEERCERYELERPPRKGVFSPDGFGLAALAQLFQGLVRVDVVDIHNIGFVYPIHQLL